MPYLPTYLLLNTLVVRAHEREIGRTIVKVGLRLGSSSLPY